MLRQVVMLGTIVALAATPAWAGADSRDVRLSRHYSAGALDGEPVVLTVPADGSTWAAWAYRSGGEYSIALSTLDARGLWSQPVLIGLDDGLNQVDPAVAADAAGNLYLAYAVRETGSIHVSALASWRDAWFEPQVVTEPGQRASAPSLRVVADRLVLAFRSGRRVEILDWALLGEPTLTANGIQEGPDGFPLPGREKRDDEQEILPDDSAPQPPTTRQAGQRKDPPL